MNTGHMLCAMLPLLLAVPDAPPAAPSAPSALLADNQLEGMCRTLVMRVGEEIHTGVLLVDWLGSGLIIGADD
jgi:hypothetical protein